MQDFRLPLQPVPAAERSAWLDALRGFALFGILVVNIRVFCGVVFPRELMPVPPPVRYTAFDDTFTTLAHVFFEGKFYSLFSFLFGLGLMLLFKRADDADARAVARRRLGWLMVFGLLHGVFVWGGDILLVYGLFGFALLWFRRLSTRALLASAIAFIASPVLIYVLYLVFQVAGPGATSGGPATADPGPLPELLRHVAGDSYAELVKTNLFFTGGGWVRRATRLMLPRIFGMFLLGTWAARIGLPFARDALRPMLKRWLAWGVGLGVPMNIAFTLMGGNDLLLPANVPGLYVATLAAAGMPLLCLAYVAAFALYWKSQGTSNLFVAAGRMPLTQYIGQSVVCVGLFYGVGLGLFGRVSYTIALDIAVLVWLALAYGARLWLKSHAQGPLETVWRCLSYGRGSRLASQVA